MKFELLSDNLVVFLEEIIKNQDLCKLIKYDTYNPLSEEDLILPQDVLINERLFPVPLNPDILDDDCTQINVFYPRGDFDGSGVININALFVDIVVARSLYLINIDGKSKVRAYEIMKEIVKTFEGKSISTLGKLHFLSWVHIQANKKFEVIRLITDVMQVG